MKEAIAFAPGHISGFFEPIIDESNVNKTGSRGAGVCISHGVTARVKTKESDKQKIIIRANGKLGTFPVTHDAIKTVLEEDVLQVFVELTLDLPVGQGFGMSAASALSSSLALSSILNKTRHVAIQAAHSAEVTHHTGLGDVCASVQGGFEIRKRPGIFPFGKIIKMDEQCLIQLGIFPGSLSTRTILTNHIKVKQISSIGSYCTDQVLQFPSIDSIMKYSYYFTVNSGLAPKDILRVLAKINEKRLASMCMLGHSIFVLGNDDPIKQCLPKRLRVIDTTVDINGARIINSNF